jgi:hypothetical protein
MAGALQRGVDRVKAHRNQLSNLIETPQQRRLKRKKAIRAKAKSPEFQAQAAKRRLAKGGKA